MLLDTGSTLDVDSSSGADEAASDREAEVLEATSGAFGRDPGLGLLLDLVRRGQQDPWDIDIVALTDQYLAALDARDEGTLDARDLGQVARMIFYAAALVRLKAQTLAEREAARQRPPATFEGGIDDAEPGHDPRRGLHPGDEPLMYPEGHEGRVGQGMVAGLVPRERRPRERGLTLFDLISALRGYDDRLAQQELEAQDAIDVSAITVDECVRTAHEDHLDDDIITVRGDLGERFAAATACAATAGAVVSVSVDLDALVTTTRSRAASYLALLFLAQEEEVVLEQERCYGPLAIRPGAHWGEVRAGLRAVEAGEVAAEAQTDEDQDEVEDEVEVEAEVEDEVEVEVEVADQEDVG